MTDITPNSPLKFYYNKGTYPSHIFIVYNDYLYSLHCGNPKGEIAKIGLAKNYTYILKNGKTEINTSLLYSILLNDNLIKLHDSPYMRPLIHQILRML